MLLPDNIHPELSIYYNGSIILQELKEESQQALLDLYENAKRRNNISFPTFILSLDWLYLMEMAQLGKDGVITLCL